MAKQVVSQRLSKVFFAQCKAYNTPVSLGCWLLFKYGEYAQLVAKSVNPLDYLDASTFADDYAVTEFLSKYPSFDTGIDKAEVAKLGFKTAERKCLVSNYKIRNGMLRGFSPRVEAVLFTAARKIATVLGSVEDIDFSQGRWGPGVTTSIRGRGIVMADKLLEFPVKCSHDAIPYLQREIGTDIHWARALGIPADGPFTPLQECFEVVDACVVTTVPKNAKTDRTIGIEPTGNVFLQLAVGSHLKERLRRFGINLYDQSINQKLAKLGSRKGFLATVDMKSASDTIAYMLIECLLPEPWIELLNALRSKNYILDGEKYTFNKFSAMGNGFTFELESLIFWAIAQSILDLTNSEWKHASIYGDDIIIPVKNVEYFKTVCEAVGFTINSEKTHTDSPFRESCGKHYFRGVDVTPIYQREDLGNTTDLPSIYRLANRLSRFAMRRGCDVMFDPILVSSFLAAIAGVPVRHFVPLGSESDDGLALPLSFLKGTRYYKSVQHGGFILPVLRYRSSRCHEGAIPNEAGIAYWMRKKADGRRSDDPDVSFRKELSLEQYATDFQAALFSEGVIAALSVRRGCGKHLTRRQYFRGTAWLDPIGFPIVSSI